MATRLSDSAVFHGQSFQDMIAPLKEYSAAYKEVEQAYDTVSQSTAGIRDLISPERDSATYERYMSYANRLNDTVDDFAKGMSMGNRAALLGLKRDYASEIVPINTAIAKRNALADEQRETRLKNPTAIFQRDANTISLDRFMENPQTDYGGVIYGSVITEQARNMMKNLAKEIHDNPNNPRLKRLFPYTYEVITKKGYDSATIYDYLVNGAGDNERKNILNEIINNVVSSSGVEGWNDSNATRQVWDYAAQSVWDSIGEPWARDAYDKYSSAVALAGLSGGSGSGTTTPEGSGLRLEVRPIYSKEDQDARDNVLKNLSDLIEKGYIEKDENTGQLSFTNKGLKKIENEKNKTSYGHGTSYGYFLQNSVYSPLTVLYNAVQAQGDEDTSDADKMNSYLRSIGLDSSGNDMLIDLENNFADDIKREINYGMDIDSTNQDDWKGKIALARNNNPIPIVEWDKNSKKYVKTKDNLDWEKFYENEKWKIQSINIAPSGQLIGNILDENGDLHIIELPAGTISNDLMDIISDDMEQIQKIKELFMNDKGELTKEEIDKRKSNYEKYYQQAAETLIGSNVQNKTKEQTSEVYKGNV